MHAPQGSNPRDAPPGADDDIPAQLGPEDGVGAAHLVQPLRGHGGRLEPEAARPHQAGRPVDNLVAAGASGRQAEIDMLKGRCRCAWTPAYWLLSRRKDSA